MAPPASELPLPTSAPDPAATPLRLPFHNTYARLPEHFYARIAPTPVARPTLLKLNIPLAQELGLDPARLASPEGIAILSGNRVAEGSEPLALAYAGHQFGYFVPQLGDGRANLLGEVVALDGRRLDVQLKGSGPTPFSRRGDGRAALGPVLREYLVSEAMAALGVPTTRALAAVATGEPVSRETVLPGAIITRVAASHLRVGTFQYFLAKNDIEALRTLAHYAIDRHYPKARQSDTPARALLAGVIARHAGLVAHWMLLGFVHGVMNTDNTSISGETLDYGPCAFMEAYDPNQVFSSIDRQGRYSFSNQPHAAHWNLTRLAETLLPLMQDEAGNPDTALAWAHEELARFGPQFEAAHLAGLRRKLGLLTAREGDEALTQELLALMAAQAADFTSTFRRLFDLEYPQPDAQPAQLPAAFHPWLLRWRQRLADENIPAAQRAEVMRRADPLFIPRNHLVEQVITAATEQQNLQPFEELLDIVTKPFDPRPGSERYRTPARTEERVHATFCGT